MNIKQTVTDNWATTKTVVKNLAEFLDAVSLAAVSVFSLVTGLKRHTFWNDLLVLAAALICLQAFLLLLKHFKKT